MLKPFFAAAAVLVASALVVPTVSQAAASNSTTVSYADLNLASVAGQKSLRRRIAYGARLVCEIEDSRELALGTATRLCRGEAIEGARPAYEAAVAAANRRGTVEVLDAATLIVTAP